MAANGDAQRRPGARRPARGAKTPQPARRKAAPKPAPAPAGKPRTFTLGVVAGATPGKWIAAWRERVPQIELVLFPLAVATQREALADGDVDAALVRLPIDAGGLHLVRLYDEVTVAVVGAESHLTAAEELSLADLAGEIVISPADDVLGAQVPGAAAAAFAAPADTEAAIATVAAGVGVVLAPLSIARLHSRSDTATRPVRDAPVSTMALAWPRAASTPDIDTFVGIVRGRTANSSR